MVCEVYRDPGSMTERPRRLGGDHVGEMAGPICNGRAVRVAAGILGALLVLAMLGEFFVSFMLPVRVKRDPRLARGLFELLWRLWRWFARRLPESPRETLLGLFGPLGLLFIVALWTAGLVLGFAALQYAVGSHVRGDGVTGTFGDDLYFSAGGFLSASSGLEPTSTAAKVLLLVEAAAGFGVLFIAIGYLPALFQAFSRRETAVSRLDPRAGLPPSAGALIGRAVDRGQVDELLVYLGEWEGWAAELMETHLSYPVIGYYRSQHLGQNWLASITAVLDACALIAAATPVNTADSATLTFALARHAVSDLTYTFRATPTPAPERLESAQFEELYDLLDRSGLAIADAPTARAHLDELRGMYEPQVAALSSVLALSLPHWTGSGKPLANWHADVPERGRAGRALSRGPLP